MKRMTNWNKGGAGSELLEALSLELCASSAPWGWHPVNQGYQVAAIAFILINQHVTIALTVRSKMLQQWLLTFVAYHIIAC